MMMRCSHSETETNDIFDEDDEEDIVIAGQTHGETTVLLIETLLRSRVDVR